MIPISVIFDHALHSIRKMSFFAVIVVISTIAFSFMGVLISFMVYHFSVALALGFAPFVTYSTIKIVVNFMFGSIALFLLRFIFDLIRD